MEIDIRDLTAQLNNKTKVFVLAKQTVFAFIFTSNKFVPELTFKFCLNLFSLPV